MKYFWQRPIFDLIFNSSKGQLSIFNFQFSILILPLMAAGCSHQRQVSVKKDIEVVMSDTMAGRHLYKGLKNTKVAIRQVLLSKPDTLMKQHIEAIVEVVAASEHTYEGEESMMKERSVQTQIRTEEQERTEEKSGGHGGLKSWGWILAGAVLLLIVALICRTNHFFSYICKCIYKFIRK